MSKTTVTIEETIYQTLAVWAIPQSEWHIATYPEDGHFYYAVRTNKPWESGAIQVCEEVCGFTVPAGIDLATAAVETYKAAIEEKNAQHHIEITELKNKIDSLLVLEYIPKPTTDA
tara:strand:- start:592 stop:939 length:348 start_codon:yes stop_codon:yes gene_type:complete